MTKPELKRLINANRWEAIGAHFGFVPVYSKDREIDWQTVPKRVFDLLFQDVKGIPPVIRDSLMTGDNNGFRGKRKCRKTVRLKLWENQDWVCGYCKQTVMFSDWTIDHIIPKSKGGTNHFTNFIGACSKCNHDKGSMTLNDFLSKRKS